MDLFILTNPNDGAGGGGLQRRMSCSSLARGLDYFKISPHLHAPSKLMLLRLLLLYKLAQGAHIHAVRVRVFVCIYILYANAIHFDGACSHMRSVWWR